MKVDKESLIKNRFWVLLGVFVPLALFAVLWLETAVEGAVEADRKKMADHREKLKKNAEAKLNGNMEMNLCKEKYRKLEIRKDTIWKEAWKNQQGLVFWPAKVEKTYDDLDFGASASDSVRGIYAQADVYLAQYEDMAKMFQVKVPERTTKKGEKPKMQMIDPVQFEGGWQKVLRPVEKWKVLPPSDEEVWLAQEDVWVRHELLNALKKANTSVARFKSVSKNKPDEGPPFTQIFENPYWKIELSLYPKDQQYYVKGKITNIGKKRLALGRAYFWLQVQADEKEPRIVVPIEGASRAVGESWDIKETPLDLFQNPAGLFGLEQVLEARTAPVRRIDDIALYHHSHRTYEPTLLTPKQFARQGPAPTITPKQPVGLPSPTGTKPTVSSGLTANGLVTQRYTDVTSQVRRMPLGLVIVADQAHIPEVLTELANCKLRMQTTQVNWQHFRGKLEPETEPTPAPKGGPKPIGAPPKEKPVAEEPQNNLVELSIYGIVSLYERPGQKTENDTAKKSTPGPRGRK